VRPAAGSAPARAHPDDAHSLGAGRDAARDLAAAAALVALAALAIAHLAGFGAGYVLKSLAAYAVGAALIRRGLKRGVASQCIGGGEATAIAIEIAD